MIQIETQITEIKKEEMSNKIKRVPILCVDFESTWWFSWVAVC